MKTPVRTAIIGLGGYAGYHHHTLLELEEKREARLVCTCDPRADDFAAQRDAWKFPRRGVRVFRDYQSMLAACAGELDLVVIPTPIPLHAEMHRAAVELGLAVYLEKPPTLDFAELEAMIRTDRAAPRATQVGFNFIIERPRQALKQRLLDGEFGALRSGSLIARWGRPTSYFERNSWAGRLLADDRVVLDSCFGNAMAHFVHNLLHWAGPDALASWAQVSSVKAELFRANRIQGADTFFVEAATTAGVPLRFALTHACPQPSSQAEILHCEKASIHYVVGQHHEIRWHDGRVEKARLPAFDALLANHLDYYRYLRGETDRPATLLSDCRPFVALNDLAHIATGEITPFPADRVALRRQEQEQKDYYDVTGLALAQEEFLSVGHWPGRAWGRPGEVATVTPDDLARFHATLRTLAAAAPV